jgi:hypothetical protein
LLGVGIVSGIDWCFLFESASGRFAACVGELPHIQNCGFMYDAGITGSGSNGLGVGG